jgi:hypothetical protein
MVYTRCATELPQDLSWDIAILPPQTSMAEDPIIKLNARLDNQRRIVTIHCHFAAVERGHRAGPEELAAVADFYIRKFKEAVDQ